MWISNVEPSSWRSSRPAAAPAGRTRRGDRAGRVSPRTRRRLVAALRRLATRGGTRRRFEVLLHDRVALVRADLLQIAGLLEQAPDPDPRCVTELHRLLTDGCESPLFNPDVHPSELLATVYYVHSRLTAGAGY